VIVAVIICICEQY